jgi:hypothetical protein
MYTRKLTEYDFFKPLNKREKDRMDILWKRICWVKEKSDQREKELNCRASNLYRREYSALLWAYDYIYNHNKKIEEEKQND